MEHSDLANFVSDEKDLNESTRVDICLQIACALGYFHSLDVTYRDMKPENILVSKAENVSESTLISGTKINIVLFKGRDTSEVDRLWDHPST